VPKWFPAPVNPEIDSRAVARELGQVDRGLAVVGGLMPLAESYREQRTGGKRRQKRAVGRKMSLAGVLTPG